MTSQSYKISISSSWQHCVHLKKVLKLFNNSKYSEKLQRLLSLDYLSI